MVLSTHRDGVWSPKRKVIMLTEGFPLSTQDTGAITEVLSLELDSVPDIYNLPSA